jgi:hypothetical protein
MKVLLVWLLLACLALAQALSLPEALESVEEQEATVAAQLELNEAREANERVQADPLGLRLDKTRAQQRLELAQASLEHARARATAAITSAYHNVLTARARRDVALAEVELNTRLVEGAQIRLRNESATELDVQEAQTALEQANTDLRSSEERLELAINTLQSLLGTTINPAELESVPESFFTEIPSLETVLSNNERHPDLLRVRQARILAELSYNVLDPIYASPAEISNARTVFETAQTNEQDVERRFRILGLDLIGQATAAKESYLVAQTAQANAQSRLSVEQGRLDAGLLSQVEFLTTKVEAANANLSLLEARQNYLEALLSLNVGTEISNDGTQLNPQ